MGKALGRNRFIIYTPDRLGSLDEILNSTTVIQMSNFVTQEEKNEHLLKLIRRFNNAVTEEECREAVDISMDEIMRAYDVDAVQYVRTDGTYIQKSNYEITEPLKLMELYDTYADRMEAGGFVSIGNYENFKNNLPEVFAYLSANDLRSMFIVQNKDMNGVLKGVFVFSTHKRYQVWSAFDARMLPIICGIIEHCV